MKGLLLNLAHQFDFLFTRHWFRIVDGSPCPPGWRVVLSSFNCPFSLQFFEDVDGSTLISLHAVHDPVPDRWFDIESVRTVFMQTQVDAPTTVGNSDLFNSGMKTLCDLFSKDNVENTLGLLTVIDDERKKHLFGRQASPNWLNEVIGLRCAPGTGPVK